MSAVLQRDPQDEFFDSQMLPPQERGVTFEALYFRQLQLVTNRIKNRLKQQVQDVANQLAAAGIAVASFLPTVMEA